MKTPTLILIAGLVLISTSFAVDPPPDGGYPNNNTAEGDNALFSLTTGANNTACGAGALFNNTIGGGNTACGGNSLVSNTSGSNNTASGFQALLSNTGNNNTASGYQALDFNTTGGANTGTGAQALLSNSTGAENTSVGFNALGNNTSGSNNIALGVSAGLNLTTGSNNIDIGNAGVAAESKKIRIGTRGAQNSIFIAGISGVTVAGGVGVIIDTNGHLGTVVSSERFKDAIKPMDKASEAILSLKPVAFHYKKELDPDSIPQFGLVAEDVSKVDPDLVAKDDQGKPYTVRYEAVNAMLLNEFLKEHKTVEEQAKKVEEQASEIKELRSALQQQESQTQAQLQQLTARLAAKGL